MTSLPIWRLGIWDSSIAPNTLLTLWYVLGKNKTLLELKKKRSFYNYIFKLKIYKDTYQHKELFQLLTFCTSNVPHDYQSRFSSILTISFLLKFLKSNSWMAQKIQTLNINFLSIYDHYLLILQYCLWSSTMYLSHVSQAHLRFAHKIYLQKKCPNTSIIFDNSNTTLNSLPEPRVLWNSLPKIAKNS